MSLIPSLPFCIFFNFFSSQPGTANDTFPEPLNIFLKYILSGFIFNSSDKIKIHDLMKLFLNFLSFKIFLQI